MIIGSAEPIRIFVMFVIRKGWGWLMLLPLAKFEKGELKIFNVNPYLVPF